MRRIKKLPRYNICPDHNTNIKNCCLPVMESVQKVSFKKLTRYMNCVNEISKELKMNHAYTDMWRGLRYQVIKEGRYKGQLERNGTCLSSDWGYISIHMSPQVDPTPTDYGYNMFDGTNQPKIVDMDNDFIDLKQIYISKKYQGTGIGTKVIEVMKKKCIKYDFSLSLVSGSVRFNKKIYKSSLHDCNQGTFYVNQFKKNNKFRKIGIVAGMNPRHWEQMTEFESEIVQDYEEHITEDMFKETPYKSLKGSYSFTWNKPQVEEGNRIRDWYLKRGFNISFSYLNDWAVLRDNYKGGKIKDWTTYMYNGDTHFTWWNPNHIKELVKLHYMDIDTYQNGTTGYDLFSTMEYMKHIILNNRTDLVGRKTDRYLTR
tara:strand:- start:8009 stop:9124 length:1116 start_codon:yes stop_codon:yes gene_type:complete